MEDDLFLKKMKGVQPIKKDKQNLFKNKPNLKTVKKQKTQNKKTEQITTKEFKEAKLSNFEISFGAINKDLKKGRIKIDRKLDLHGHSLMDAKEIFKNEVIKMYNANKRCLLVITGKGAYKDTYKTTLDDNITPRLFYGKIKNSIKSWINEDNLKKYILTYQDAGIEYGGDGAIYVYLRKKT